MARILIADDEPGILSLYKTKLAQAGFEVLSATNGKEALKIAETEKPDLILLDVKMPELDGIAAAKELRQNPAISSIPFVFLTAFSDPTVSPTGEELFDAGAIDFIRKGINLDELVEKVRGYIAR